MIGAGGQMQKVCMHDRCMAVLPVPLQTGRLGRRSHAGKFHWVTLGFLLHVSLCLSVVGHGALSVRAVVCHLVSAGKHHLLEYSGSVVSGVE